MEQFTPSSHYYYNRKFHMYGKSWRNLQGRSKQVESPWSRGFSLALNQGIEKVATYLKQW